MTKYRLSNRCSALLITQCLATATTAALESGGGSRFPILLSGEVAPGALISSSGVVEYVTITAIAGDVVTLERAKEGSAAATFPIGSRLEVRITAAVFDNVLQKSGGTMTGDIDMNGNRVLNAQQPGVVSFTNIHVNLLRSLGTDINAPYSVAENSIYIPPDGRQPMIQNSPILNTKYFQYVIFTAYIDVFNVPPYFKLCDGTNFTPDLRGIFIRGWSAELGVSGRGGALGALTNFVGNHAHTGFTEFEALDESDAVPIATTQIKRNVQSGTGATVVENVAVNYSGSAGHRHPISTDGIHQHYVDTLPPFFCLAYVMFNQ